MCRLHKEMIEKVVSVYMARLRRKGYYIDSRRDGICPGMSIEKGETIC